LRPLGLRRFEAHAEQGHTVPVQTVRDHLADALARLHLLARPIDSSARYLGV